MSTGVLENRRNTKAVRAEARGGTRGRAAATAGFSLIELLMVCLIIGVLAAIAIPLFAGAQAKAADAQAKELARTAQTAAESIGSEHDGSYASVSRSELNTSEPTIHIVASTREAYLSAATGGPSDYSVTAKATSGDELTITRSATGQITRSCASPVSKTGCSNGATGSW